MNVRLVAVFASAALALSGCGAPHWEPGTPYPHDFNFGYLSAGAIVHSQFFGEPSGIGPGTGVSLTLPLSEGVVVTTLVVAAIVAIVAIVASGGGSGNLGGNWGGDWPSGSPASGDDDIWCNGMTGPNVFIFREYSFDFSFSMTSHDDLLYGGTLDYSSLLFGMRVGRGRQNPLHVYLNGGIGWHWLSWTAPQRADAGGCSGPTRASVSNR